MSGKKKAPSPKAAVAQEELDSADLDAVKDLERSPGYALVRERVTAEIERLGRELEGDLDAEKTAKLRGQLRAYRTLLTIPGILKSEIEREVKV
ncbi:MAG: hypothetical protein LAP40_16885 [Acidobacteriia bacterium]|nr:hypothetical protein [Terriglobia bacterium]